MVNKLLKEFILEIISSWLSFQMSDIKTSIQNDNDKDAEKDSLSEQASPNTSINMHTHEDEEKDVRGALPNSLHTKDKTRGDKINTDTKTNPFLHKEYTVFVEYGRQGSVDHLDYDEDNEDRNVFVRKVMLILFIMLLITFAFNLTVMLMDGLKLIFRRFFLYILIPCMLGMFVLACVMPTSSCARRSPTNYVCLTLVVILYSLVCACFTSFFKTDIVVQALLVTLLLVALCVILACTKFDFTKWILYVIAIGFALSMLTIIYIVATWVFNVKSTPIRIALLVATILVNTVMLIIELQMVLGGKAVQLGEEDYALGAYMLYTSIVELFMDILLLLSKIKE